MPAWTSVYTHTYTYNGARAENNQVEDNLPREEAAGSRGTLPNSSFLLLPLGTWHVALGYSKAFVTDCSQDQRLNENSKR